MAPITRNISLTSTGDLSLDPTYNLDDSYSPLTECSDPFSCDVIPEDVPPGERCPSSDSLPGSSKDGQESETVLSPCSAGAKSVELSENLSTDSAISDPNSQDLNKRMCDLAIINNSGSNANSNVIVVSEPKPET